MNRRWFLIFGSAFSIILFSIAAFNIFSLHIPAVNALNSDPRNSVAKWAVYHRWGIAPKTIVLDLRSVELSAAPVDINRMLFQIADRFQGRSYDRIVLAYRGEARFLLTGSYFSRIGEEYSWQNPVFLMRELPQNTLRISGEPAFETWTGGWLGVMNAQMNDLNSLHQEWYIVDLTN